MEATLLAQEALDAVRSIRDESWTANIASLINGTSYYPIVENGKWRLTTTSPGVLYGKYTRSVIFDQVLRDGQDKISLSGTLDPGTRKVTARISWPCVAAARQVDLVTYITDFTESIAWPSEVKSFFFETPTTDADLASFPSDNAGDGDPVQSFTTGASAVKITKAEFRLRRTTPTPSPIYVELRAINPTGTVLGTSNTITASTTLITGMSWVEFRFAESVALSANTEYFLRLRSVPDSTIAGSGSSGRMHWMYQQTGPSPYSGGKARRYVGRLSNPNDNGQVLDQYDFGFRVYTLQ